EDVSDTLASVLKGAPNWNALPLATPVAIRRLLRRALEKDPRRRLHDIADARLELDDAIANAGEDSRAESSGVGGASPSAWRRALPWTVAGVLAAAFAVAIATWAGRP